MVLDDCQHNNFHCFCRIVTESFGGTYYKICFGGYYQKEVSILAYGVQNKQKGRDKGILQRLSYWNFVQLYLCAVLAATLSGSEGENRSWGPTVIHQYFFFLFYFWWIILLNGWICIQQSRNRRNIPNSNKYEIWSWTSFSWSLIYPK